MKPAKRRASSMVLIIGAITPGHRRHRGYREADAKSPTGIRTMRRLSCGRDQGNGPHGGREIDGAVLHVQHHRVEGLAGHERREWTAPAIRTRPPRPGSRFSGGRRMDEIGKHDALPDRLARILSSGGPASDGEWALSARPGSARWPAPSGRSERGSARPRRPVLPAPRDPGRTLRSTSASPGFLEIGQNDALGIGFGIGAGLAQPLGRPEPEELVAAGRRLEAQLLVMGELLLEGVSCARRNRPLVILLAESVLSAI